MLYSSQGAIMKIYTKTGDSGKTSLVGGERVLKDDARIEAYGAIDELNSIIGVAISHIPSELKDAIETLLRIQHQLLNIGSELASLSDRKTKAMKIPHIDEQAVSWLEKQIDHYDNELSPLKNFILPGGTGAASFLHQARTVCRRAERRIVALNQEQPINSELIRYINRLSDLLFTLARLANARAQKPDQIWRND